MRTQRGKIIMPFLLLALIVGASVSTNAQRGNRTRTQVEPMGQGMQAQGMGQNPNCVLNLSSEQFNDIQSLRIEHKGATTPLRNQMNEARARLHTQRSSNPNDLGAINSTIDEFTEIKNQLMKENAAHRARVSNILTDEQRIVFNARGNRGQRGMGISASGYCTGSGYGQGQGQGMGRGQGQGMGRGFY